MTAHLRPTAAIAPDVLLPGDPGRALALAQELLAAPLMSNHNRGLWGYSGTTHAGLPLTIQSSGIGGPSLAVVVADLAEHGARRIIRVGTCRALGSAAVAGELLVVDGALAQEGASRALGGEGAVRPDPALGEALRAAARSARPAAVVSTDLAYGGGGGGSPNGEAVAAELGTATLFTLGPHLGLAVAAALVVSADRRRRLADAELEKHSLRLGREAAAAFAS